MRPTPPGPPLPEGEPVLSKTTDQYQWQLYVSRSQKSETKGETCLDFTVLTQRGRSGGGACELRRPIDFVGCRCGGFRFLWGNAPQEAASVRVEHAGGEAETFPTATANARGFVEAFLGGEIAKAPVTRLVALDDKGREIAESRDVGALNT